MIAGAQQYHYQKNSKFDPESDEEDDDDYDEADSPINVSWKILIKLEPQEIYHMSLSVFYCLMSKMHTSQIIVEIKNFLPRHGFFLIFQSATLPNRLLVIV